MSSLNLYLPTSSKLDLISSERARGVKYVIDDYKHLVQGVCMVMPPEDKSTPSEIPIPMMNNILKSVPVDNEAESDNDPKNKPTKCLLAPFLLHAVSLQDIILLVKI